ncbi:MAG TPA: YggS family pyridoxal phosphate-dependent enzyme [Streptosporangiales bacterium]
MDERRAELAANLAAVEKRLTDACEAAGRRREDVTLIAVTKTFPASDVRLLADLGVRHVGENRDQDAAPKAEACADLDLTWHFVGALQTNKARSVARYADWVHSVDRDRLVTALGKAAHAAGRTLRCLVEVRLGAGEERAGAEPADVPRLAELVASTDGLTLGGVMGIAPLDAPPEPAFVSLAEVAEQVRRVDGGATAISAGMSADLEAAVCHGATHVRIGTALLGIRPANR